MTDGFGRRDFLKGAVVGGVAATSTTIAQAQPAPAAAAPAATASPGYAFLNLDEAAFVEALVDHMVPADDLTPSGTDIGINVYIDRALAGAWGKGDRLYMQGPWKAGAPSQGYQLPLTPAQLYRAGIEATNAHCRKSHGKTFDRLSEQQRVLDAPLEQLLVGMRKQAAQVAVSALGAMHARLGHTADLELRPCHRDALLVHRQVCHERPALAAQHEAVHGHFLRVAPLAEERIVRLVEATRDELAQLAVELRRDVGLSRVLES